MQSEVNYLFCYYAMFAKATELITASVLLLRKRFDRKTSGNNQNPVGTIKKLLIFIIVFAVAIPVFALEASKVYEKVLPSTVIVWATQKDGKKSQGSGVIVGHGEVVTNCHVLVESDSVADSIKVQDSGGAIKVASLSGADWEKDICLLKSRDLKGKIINTRQSGSLSVGEVVYAISAPGGNYRISAGRVSQLHKRERSMPPVIITSAQLAPGMSGGGLFDEHGKLIGITTKHLPDAAEYSGFAYPTEWINWTRRRGVKNIADAKLNELFGESSKQNRKIALDLINVQDWSGLEKHSKEWSDLYPSDELSWSFLGLAYLRQGTYYKAIESYRKSVSISPDNSGTWYNLGVAYSKQGRYKKAVDSYRKAVSIDPDDSKAWHNMIIAYISDDQYEKAQEAYLQLQRLDPNSAIKLKKHVFP